jgi:hypothetical protein
LQPLSLAGNGAVTAPGQPGIDTEDEHPFDGSRGARPGGG